MSEIKTIKVIGGGLAGSETAWQLAEAIREFNLPYHVELYEMRPQVKTPAHHTDRLAELVCSNSLGSEYLTTARGVLINEMQEFNSLIIKSAIKAKVPAGQALAVDRDVFGEEVTSSIENHPHITLIREEFKEKLTDYLNKDDYIVIATGPLTSEILAQEIQDLLQAVSASRHPEIDSRHPEIPRCHPEQSEGSQERTGDPSSTSFPQDDGLTSFLQEDGLTSLPQVDASFLHFFDAASPILTAESIDMDIAYRGSRYDKHEEGSEGDYINCPFYDQEEFDNFYNELINAERAPQKEFEKENFRYFQACMPIEAIADKGKQTLTFGPMKPKGLRDPRDPERKAVAVVQLRQDNVIGSLYNIVGFQTNLKWGEQKRVFSMIPGLKDMDIVRYGVMHQNIFINSPLFLNADMSLKLRHPDPERSEGEGSQLRIGDPSLTLSPQDDDKEGHKVTSSIFFAGQITGVEGYTESAASGIIAARSIILSLCKERDCHCEEQSDEAIHAQAKTRKWIAASQQAAPRNDSKVLPKETMMGALANYISSCEPKRFQPINSNWGLINTEPDQLEKQYRKNKKLRYEFLANRALNLIKKYGPVRSLSMT